ncbi:hypothetical protein ATK74_0029 [Propionicimonas paludicola]|uniref:Uncharacterized protein n=1 Tax=Propionicimonas paludicola TaxID=185243 RepID=A0A2A9CPC4_9ACTN|nr:hypothetical protein [Propionicimonas paludicola]PFG15510.1 hypothetical protein ATK74_0029 [Propionicimonas paludicola]
MANTHSHDQAMDAVTGIRPDADELAHRWHLGRSEANLRTVLGRTANPNVREGETSAAGAGASTASRMDGRRLRARWVVVPVVAAAVVTAVVLVTPRFMSSRPVEAIPVATPTPQPTASPTPRWATSALAPDDMPLVPYFEAIRKAKGQEAAQVSESDQRKWWQQRETFLGQCMGKAGFEYFPRGYDQPSSAARSEFETRKALRYRDTLPIPALDDDRAVVASVGYGLSSPPGQFLDQLASADPKNTDYIASLSPQRHDEYDIAMNGQTSHDTRSNPMTKGCYWESEKRYPEPDASSFNNQIAFMFMDVIPGILNFTDDASIEADSRVVALNDQWRACMAREGFDFAAFRALQTDGAGPFDGPQAAILLASLTGDDGTVATYPLPSDAPAGQGALTGSAPQLRVALADYDCRQAVGYTQGLIDVQRDLEKRFVTKHQARLDELLSHVRKNVP